VNVDRVRHYLLETSRTASRMAERYPEAIVGAAAAIVSSLREGGKLLICGNGRSGADAQYIATEFVSTLTVDRRRPAIAAIAVTTDTSLLTAVSNDDGFDNVPRGGRALSGRAAGFVTRVLTSEHTFG
jgi:D-sedoheptulose 7-phosphate isomerase